VTERDNIPRLGSKPGYEVWFITFTDPATGQGFWIRSTITNPAEAGADPRPAVWFARFDPGDPDRTFGVHRAGSTSAATDVGDEAFEVRIDGTLMASGIADGSIEGGGHAATWSLTWPTGPDTYRLLPDWMYRGGMAPTRPYSPNVQTTVRGTLTVDGERLDIHDAPAQQGHLIGKRHADRWAWAQCGAFDGVTAVVHAIAAQGRRGPVHTPFVTSIGVLWDGRWIRMSKSSRRRDFGLGTWKIDVGNGQYRLTGRVEAPARDLIRARYEDPDGTPRYCHNSETASSRLVLFERTAGAFEEVALLESRGTTHAEWAGLTPAAEVAREHEDVTAVAATP
jgi:Tocopherol cyclase